ncbi:ABC transporter ATP-binding protein [Rothia sp. ZJ1223]|uniref:ABC transporter ATP-binding protein n=1 Tax=Rothia sp. ZJ1223 TaxID=2811098 RepID=UPI0019583F9E|nr:ABC transporter ATP-binding protein [Rothia sp. ZJ1223]MBM7051655.1 ABC transporter ATP-binding protein [Rothia sp. ZJ1223]
MTISNSLSVVELGFSYPAIALWENISFEAPSGSFIALRGHSGSGKTTLLQCLGGLEKPTAGDIKFDNINPAHLKGKSRRDFLRTKVSFAFQNSGLVASWTVRQNLDIAGYKVAEHKAEAQEAFERFNLDYDYLDRPVFQLSGGEQQRVGLIRLALRHTPLVLLDEPTAALDDDNAGRVVDFVNQHCAKGGIAVIATHDARLVEHADVSIILN